MEKYLILLEGNLSTREFYTETKDERKVLEEYYIKSGASKREGDIAFKVKR